MLTAEHENSLSCSPAALHSVHNKAPARDLGLPCFLPCLPRNKASTLLVLCSAAPEQIGMLPAVPLTAPAKKVQARIDSHTRMDARAESWNHSAFTPDQFSCRSCCCFCTRLGRYRYGAAVHSCPRGLLASALWRAVDLEAASSKGN